MSRASKKSSKLLNASLERVHTFGMANLHKSLYDLEKIDNQYDSILSNKKKINKTISHANFKNTVHQPESSGVLDNGESISVNISIKTSPKNNNNAPVTSLKFMNTKENKSELLMSPGENKESPEERKSRQSKNRGHSQSMEINMPDDPSKSKLDASTEKQSQSLNVISDKDAIENPNKSEFELKLDNYSSINCISEQPSKSNTPSIIDQAKTKISYYVRDEFQPL